MSDVRMSRRPEGLPLEQYDAALWSRLTKRLVETLVQTLHQPPSVASELASGVRWTVEQDKAGLWMTMTFPGGGFSAVGGDWPQDQSGLDWYIDDVAYMLAGQGGAPCHEGD